MDTGGSDTGGDDAGGDDAGDDDAGDVCASAVEDDPCDSEGTSCGGELCTDECSFCNILMCEGGMWERLEAFPAPCFSCGDELQCVLDSEVCNVTLGGIGGMTYACSPLPDECGGEPSCDCIPAGPGTCSGDAETGITVTIATP